MQGNGLAKLIITILAIVCVALIVIFAVKNKPDCAGEANNNPDISDYGTSVSDGDYFVDDTNTQEMDSIPSNADAPVAPDGE